MSSGMTPSTTLDLFGRNNIARSRHVTRETLAEGASSLQLLSGALNYGFTLVIEVLFGRFKSFLVHDTAM